MKVLRLIVFSIFTITLLWGCRHSETETPVDAALALYGKYADNDRLTVAYVGDYKVQESSIEAVMVQANDSKDWDWLQEEFGVPTAIEGLLPDSVTEQRYSVDMGVQWDGVLMDDAILTKEHLSDAEIESIAQVVVDELSATISSLFSTELELGATSIVIGDESNLMDGMKFDMGFRDTTAIARISEMVAQKLNNGLNYKDSSLQASSVVVDVDSYGPRNLPNTKQEAMDRGLTNHITVVDHGNRTLWAFFYENKDECDRILAHIRKDIFTF